MQWIRNILQKLNESQDIREAKEKICNEYYYVLRVLKNEHNEKIHLQSIFKLLLIYEEKWYNYIYDSSKFSIYETIELEKYLCERCKILRNYYKCLKYIELK